MKVSLSVVFITKNEEFHIGDAIDNVSDLAGEVFVVDSGSTDRTVAIAEAVGTNSSNPYFPLIRYGMGDIALVKWQDGKPIVQGIEGRDNEQITLFSIRRGVTLMMKSGFQFATLRKSLGRSPGSFERLSRRRSERPYPGFSGIRVQIWRR